MAPVATSDRSRTAGLVLCLVSACGFGLMAIFAKEAYAAGLGVTALLAARFVLAASVFWAIVGLRGRWRAGRGDASGRRDTPGARSMRPGADIAFRDAPAAPPMRPDADAGAGAGFACRDAPGPPSVRPGRRVVLAGLGLGAIGYAAQAGLFFSALRHIDASLTSLLLYTYPALVFCGAVALRREAVTPRKALALALASAGAGLVLLGGGTHGLQATGVALALAAGATYAVYILVADGVVGRIDAFLLGALVATGAAATFLLAGAATGALTFTSGGWIWITAIALVSTVLPIASFMLGMARVGASTASIVSTAEPVVTVALAVALYGDALGPLQVLGGVLVLVAVVALQARGARAVAPVATRGRFAHESA